jgi:hypothetical protein
MLFPCLNAPPVLAVPDALDEQEPVVAAVNQLSIHRCDSSGIKKISGIPNPVWFRWLSASDTTGTKPLESIESEENEPIYSSMTHRVHRFFRFLPLKEVVCGSFSLL